METRNTVQRGLVLGAVRALASHPTAEDVYQQVVKVHNSISKATVYRNLSALCQSEALIRIPMPDTADRFDHRTDSHHHIVCTKCGAFADASSKYDFDLDKAIERQTGYTNVVHNLLITGVCPCCAPINA